MFREPQIEGMGGAYGSCRHPVLDLEVVRGDERTEIGAGDVVGDEECAKRGPSRREIRRGCERGGLGVDEEDVSVSD